MRPTEPVSSIRSSDQPIIRSHAPLCHHIKDDGVRCGSPALAGKQLCYFHDRQRKTFPHRRPYRSAQFCRTADFFNVKTPDDVMIAINQVMNGVLRGQLSPNEARALLFALQTATIFAPAATTTKPASPTTKTVSPTVQTDDPNWPPKSIEEIFERFPGLDDLKSMLGLDIGPNIDSSGNCPERAYGINNLGASPLDRHL